VAWPIYTKNPAGLKAMLENGADPNARYPTPRIERYKDGSVGTYYKNSAMVWAAKEDNSVYLKLLLDNGGDPNTNNSNDETLLFQAMIWQNQWKNVQLLVERGANINAPHAGMAAPILEHYASSRTDFKSAYWLMEHGADPRLEYHGDLAKPPFSMQADSRTIEAIFWIPTEREAAYWQLKCQRWLLSRGYQRPPMPERHRKTRADFGFPTEEKDIPLPDIGKEATL
jgi:uncharacterized protein